MCHLNIFEIIEKDGILKYKIVRKPGYWLGCFKLFKSLKAGLGAQKLGYIQKFKFELKLTKLMNQSRQRK